ncbi:MAG TPA: ABC transporter permease [Terracidiphilus sp.]|jgi:putative ABC transport system permease protein|nr:ABC transporter permease [Terracidiphilus sp.]
MPDWREEIAERLKSIRLDSTREIEIVEELSQHLEDRYEELLCGGTTNEEACRTVRMELNHEDVLAQGLLRTVGEAPQNRPAPGASGHNVFGNVWQDLRYALRQVQRNPGFALVAIFTLALGIGASTAIFSVIDNVVLEPFPYKDAGRIVHPRVHGATDGADEGRQGFSADEFLAMAEPNRTFQSMIGTADDPVLYKHGAGVEWLYGADMTPGSFEFFGMTALYGRGLEPADYKAEAAPVFVLRYKTWKAHFNGDPSVLNKVFVLNGTARTLVGIMPERFGWYDADVWIPRTPNPGTAAGFAGLPERWFILGRPKPGVTLEQGSADLTGILSRMAKLRPQDYPAQFQVYVIQLGNSGAAHFESTLYTVLSAVGLLLLIACANVANLMLARATSREKEFALRAVLGAGQGSLVRLLLVESLVMAAGGAVLGVLIAWGGLKLIVTMIPPDSIPAESAIGLNAPVLAFALLLAALTPLIFGLAPALQAARRDLNRPLRDAGRGVIGGIRTGRLRDAAVVMEVAVSLTLLIAAGLLMHSFLALRNVSLGLRADHVFKTMVLLPPDRYKTAEQVSAFIRPVLESVKAIPGVVDAAESSSAPPNNSPDSKIEVVGKAPDEQWRAQLQSVSGTYFRLLSIPFETGRGFTAEEVNDAKRVAVVNRKFASTYLGGEDPIGRQVKIAALRSVAGPEREPSFEIVGVVDDVSNQGSPGYGRGGLEAPIEPQVWVPYTVTGSGMRGLVIRTLGTPMALMDQVQAAVWAKDAGVALMYPEALDHMISRRWYAGPRFALLLMILFGCVGLILVAVGVYSVLAYTTAQKTHEIGIRMALGAERANVLRLVVFAGLRLVMAGVALGLAASLMLGRAMESELWPGVKFYDPATLASTVVVLLATGVVACWVPARRAARVDPMVALRHD